MPVISATCYELLGVPVEAPAEELESAWKLRRLEAEQRLGSLAAEEVEAICARVDEAFRILADPIRAERYRRYRETVERSAVDDPALEAPEWGHDPDAVLTDPGLRAWPPDLAAVTDDVEEPAVSDDLDLLADVVRAAKNSRPLPDPRELPPWREADAPVVRSERSPASASSLAPAAIGPDEERTTPSGPPW